MIFPKIKKDAKVSVFGCLDGIEGQEFRGWLLDINAPDQNLAIQVKIGTALIAEGKTSILRQDISQICGHNAHCGFAIPFSQKVLFEALAASNEDISAFYDDQKIFSNLARTSLSFFDLCSKQKPTDPIKGKILSVHNNTVLGTYTCLKKKFPGKLYLIDIQENTLTTVLPKISDGSQSANSTYSFSFPFPQHLQGKKCAVCFPDGTLLRNGILNSPESIESDFVGFVEKLDQNLLSGWVFSCEDKDASIPVRIYCKDTLLGECLADGYREDIAEQYSNNGFHGFSYTFPRKLQQSELLQIHVRPESDLEDLPFVKNLQKQYEEIGEFDKPLLKATIDRITPTECSGWACNVHDVDEDLEITIYVNDVEIGRTRANLPREDVRKALGYNNNNNNNGFFFSFPYGLHIDETTNFAFYIEKYNTFINYSRDKINLRECIWTKKAQNTFCETLFKNSSPYPQPSVALVVLNKNGANHLRRLFESFAVYNSYTNYKFIIIDHGSIDDSRDVCTRFSKDLPIDVYARGENCSFSDSNNFGVAQSESDYVLILNNDIIFCQDILGAMVSYLETGAIDILGIQLQTPPNPNERRLCKHTQHLGVSFSFVQGGRPFLAYEVPLNPQSEAISHSVYSTPAVTAACMMISRANFNKVGGFHEGYFYGYEDVDFCLYAHEQCGLTIACANTLVAYHVRGASRDCDKTISKRVAKNKLLLEERVELFLKQKRRSEWMAAKRLYRFENFRIAFLVSTISLDAAEGDFFTAYELGEELAHIPGIEVAYLPRESWYDLSGFDVVIALIHDFNPRQIRRVSPYCVLIAWIRNNFDRWFSLPWMDWYDDIWSASFKGAKEIEIRYQRPAHVIPIATNFERFSKGRFCSEFSCDYTFTGSFFKAKRQIIDDLKPERLPYVFKLFGHNWEKVPSLRDWHAGALNYFQMPNVYASTKIVLDDANYTVLHWGSVNSRVFDALAAGVLVITNSHGASDELFEGLLPVYEDSDDLMQKISYYLTHEDERKALVLQLQDIVRSHHTYAHRKTAIESLLREMGRSLRILLRNNAVDKESRAIAKMVQKTIRTCGHMYHSEGSPLFEYGYDMCIDLGYAEKLPHIPYIICIDTAKYQTNQKKYRSYDASILLHSKEHYSLLNDGESIDDIPTHVIAQRIHGFLETIFAKVQEPAVLPEPVCTHYIKEEPSEKKSASIPVLFSPDYTATNPYQKLLYQGLPEVFSCKEGSLSDALELLSKGIPTIFHQHWLSPILGTCTTRETVSNQIQAYLSDVQAFVDKGGIFIWTIHNVVSHEATFAELEIFLCKALCKLATKIHVHSESVLSLVKDFYEIPPEKVVVGSHGIFAGCYCDTRTNFDARTSLGLPKNAVVFLFFGQIRSYKGISQLLDAFSEVSRQHKDAYLIIAGKVLDSNPHLFKHLPPHIITHLDFVPDEDVELYFKASDFTVLPYTSILTSGSAYLSLTFGIPVIAPDKGLLSEIVRETGFLYTNSLAGALEKALALKPSERVLLKKKTKDFAKNLTWDSAHDALCRAYASVFSVEQKDHPRGKLLIRSPKKKKERTAVVILHYHHLEDTIRCRESLSSNCNVYLVSNDEDTAAFCSLCARFPEDVVIQSPANLGYAGGNNLALEMVSEEFVCILNPDTVVEKRTLGEFESFFDANPNVEIAGSAIVFGDRPEKVWYGGGNISWTNGLECSHAYINANVADLPAEPYSTDYITGACIFMRQSVLKKVGYIPEEYFLYFEETDWFIQAVSQGITPFVIPSIQIQHHKRSEQDGIPTETFCYYYCRNALLLTNKYHPELIAKTEERIREKAKMWFQRAANIKIEMLAKIQKAVNDGIMAAKSINK